MLIQFEYVFLRINRTFASIASMSSWIRYTIYWVSARQANYVSGCAIKIVVSQPKRFYPVVLKLMLPADCRLPGRLPITSMARLRRGCTILSVCANCVPLTLGYRYVRWNFGCKLAATSFIRFWKRTTEAGNYSTFREARSINWLKF